MQMPSITELEQERLRRERDRIMKAPQLPDIQVTACGLYYTKIKIGTVEVKLRSELGNTRDNKAAVTVLDAVMKRDLLEVFPDAEFVERVLEPVVKAMTESLGKVNGTLIRYHERNVSGGSR